MELKDGLRREVPEWLERQEPAELLASGLPLKEALHNSLFYPAADEDWNPIKLLGGFIHNFIYADYRMEKKRLDRIIKYGVADYHLAGTRSLNQRDLAPKGWESKIADEYKEDMLSMKGFMDLGDIKPSFATWYIFRRNSTGKESHGPEIFSVVYFCADGVSVYQNRTYVIEFIQKYSL